MKFCDLSIIILNYNTSDWLTNALESIDTFADSAVKKEVIVVDNASTDDSVPMIKKKFSWVKLIVAQENGGFAKGNNLGIQQAQGRYIMLLNSDAEFTGKTNLTKIVDFLDKSEDVGILTPRIELPDGALDLASHRGEPTVWASISYFAKLEQLFPNSKLFGQYHQTWKSFDEIHDIDACSGAGMIVRTEAIKHVGLLDERFFMYAEDLDWCHRFRDDGYRIVYFPDALIIHHKYKSGLKNQSSSTSSKASHHFFETMKQYYEKHYGKNSQFKNTLIHWGVEGLKRIKKS